MKTIQMVTLDVPAGQTDVQIFTSDFEHFERNDLVEVRSGEQLLGVIRVERVWRGPFSYVTAKDVNLQIAETLRSYSSLFDYLKQRQRSVSSKAFAENDQVQVLVFVRVS